MEPRDRPGHEAPPWESASMRGLNPKILFSSREEQQDILSKFGETLVFWACLQVAQCLFLDPKPRGPAGVVMGRGWDPREGQV